MIKTIFSLFFMSLFLSTVAQEKLYELRVYHCHEGKRLDLVKRFNDHTTKLFEKHGMENIGYWLPTNEGMENDLIYVLAFPNQEARDKSWKDFIADPEWKSVYTASRVNGALVDKIDSKFLRLEPELTGSFTSNIATPERLFELRSYYLLPGRFPNIVARFRDHTRALFQKHGMENIAYWSSKKDTDDQAHLVYILAHKDADAAKVSWNAFRTDPEWIAARNKSEETGKIVEKVESIYLKPLPFSLLK